MNYYNEYDAKAAAWLRELIAAGEIPAGDVDERSILEVKPDEIAHYTQAHFFAGIGGWPLALRLAGWPEDRPIWTGSCPCQPFSIAGKGLAHADERHLWPAFFGLIRECSPSIVIGEQVASKAALGWIDGVFVDLEGAGYACGAADLCTAGIGGPHIRQRLYWIADHGRCGERGEEAGTWTNDERRGGLTGSGAACGLANVSGTGSQGDGHSGGARSGREGCATERNGANGDFRVGEPNSPGSQQGQRTAAAAGNAESDDERRERESRPGERRIEPAGRSGAWSNFDIIPCRDGKARRIESGTFPLVDGFPRGLVHSRDSGVPINPKATAEARVMRLKGYGNAIVPVLAAKFIEAALL